MQTNHIRPRYPSTYRDVVQLSEAESQLLQSLLNEFAHMNDDNYWPKARQAVLRAFWNTVRARPPEPSA